MLPVAAPPESHRPWAIESATARVEPGSTKVRVSSVAVPRQARRRSASATAVPSSLSTVAAGASKEAGRAERAESAKAGSAQIVGVERSEVSLLEIPHNAKA